MSADDPARERYLRLYGIGLDLVDALGGDVGAPELLGVPATLAAWGGRVYGVAQAAGNPYRALAEALNAALRADPARQAVFPQPTTGGQDGGKTGQGPTG